MPRAKATTEEENVEKKTPRKRAAPKKKTASKAVAKKVAPKKTVSKKPAVKKAPTKRKVSAKKTIKKEVVEEIVVEEPEVITTKAAATNKRKAPTVFASEVAKKRAIKMQAIVVCVLLTMGIGASAAVGFNDSGAGKINVEETIKEQNARMANMVDVDGPTVVASAPNRATIPDSGFIASADQSTRVVAQPPVINASSTASSTDAVATSTSTGFEDELIAESALLNPGEASAVDTATTTVTAIDQNDESELGTPPESDDSIEQIE